MKILNQIDQAIAAVHALADSLKIFNKVVLALLKLASAYERNTVSAERRHNQIVRTVMMAGLLASEGSSYNRGSVDRLIAEIQQVK